VTKVLLVLAVIVLAVGVVWFVSHRWGKAEPSTKTPIARKSQDPPVYNDPLATYQRWRDRLTGPEPGSLPDARTGLPGDLRSSSEHEGAAAARYSDTPVAGADPPGPTLRPTGVPGEVVAGGWRLRGPAAGGDTYTIVAGDTLYGIAMKHYGDPRCVPIIETANPGLNSKALKVGDKILLPAKPAPAAPAAGTPGAAAVALATKAYIVQKNDTLIGISKRVYGDASMYRKIYEANKDILSSPNATLHVGQKLRLPEK
jgi:nucleoid-associated protein YgaU